MKRILPLFFLLPAIGIFSQTTATDWTANDCSGNSVNLFTELNQGKVIVMVWVMPCGLCITPTQTAYNVAQSFSSSGCDVDFYLMDDYANTNCTTLSNWATTNAVGTNSIKFSNAVIDMTDYGAAAMPKIVVVGGPTHTVYAIQNNAANGTALQTAITTACTDIANSVKDISGNIASLSLFPNPVSEKSTLSFDLVKESHLSIEVYDLLGSRIKSLGAGAYTAGSHNLEWNAKDLSDGIYFIRLTEGTRARVIKFVVQR